MRRTVRISAIAAIIAAAAGAASAGPVTVEFEGVEARGGKFTVVLSAREEFLRETKLFRQVDAPAAGTLRVTFDDVTPGEYAVVAMHDADGDGKLKMGAFGPEEGWAFSGPPLMSAPDFDTQKIAVPAEGATVRIRVVYPAN